MKFTIVVLGAPYSSQSPSSALRFARAVLEAGHDIYRLFFYHDGVYNGNAHAVPPQDEEHIPKAWQSLILENDLDAVVCASSALRRGLLDASEAERYDKGCPTLLNGFVISGLGQLVDELASLTVSCLFRIECPVSRLHHVFVYRNRPYGISRANVGVDLMLTAGTFDQQVTAVFTDEGVLHLLGDQDSEGTGLKNLSMVFPALELYDIRSVLVAQSSLDTFSISAADLLMPVKVMKDADIASLLTQADQVFVY